MSNSEKYWPHSPLSVLRDMSTISTVDLVASSKSSSSSEYHKGMRSLAFGRPKI